MFNKLIAMVLVMAISSVFGKTEKIQTVDASLPLSARWQKALEMAGLKGNKEDFWVGYSVIALTPEGEYFWSNGRFTLHTTYPDFDNWEARPSLAAMLAGDTATPGIPAMEILQAEARRVLENRSTGQHNQHRLVEKPLAIIFGYSRGAATPSDFHQIRLVSMDMPPRLEDAPLYWMGTAEAAESANLLREMYSSLSTRKKEFIIRAAGLHHAPAQVVAFLADVLRSAPQRELRERAAAGLGRQNHPLALETLRNAAANDLSADVREEAVEAIGEQQAPGAIEALIEFARNSHETEIRETALEALGERNTSPGNAVLQEAVYRDKEPEVQGAALEALAEQRNAASLAFLKRVLQDHPDVEIREEAVQYLPYQPGIMLSETLLSIAFGDHSDAVQETAVEALLLVSGPERSASLIRIYREHPSRDIRIEAIEILAEVAVDLAVATLNKTISDTGNYSLRLTALYTLAELPGDAGMEQIIRLALNAPELQIRKAAIRCLGESDSPVAHHALIDLVSRLNE